MNINSNKEKEGIKMSDKNIKLIVTNHMREMGTPCGIKGYNYVREAITMAVKDESILSNIVNGLYVDVAKVYNTTSSRVERAIRHAIMCTFNRGDIDVLNSYFGNSIDPNSGKATNKQFIATIANIIRLELESDT